MKRSILNLFLLISVIACQRDPSLTTMELGGSNASSEPQMVQAADGSLYSMSCLKENASEIQTLGSSAMAGCKMAVSSNSSGGEIERSRFFHSSGYSWIYYPPTYWSNNYGSGYKNTSSNLFCGFVFGGNYDFNCYALFGYNNYSNYSNYYNPTCNYCLYAPNPSKCQSKCVRYSYYYVY